jgi:hypothetical protein
MDKPLALLITADIFNKIRAFIIYSEQCELLFDVSLNEIFENIENQISTGIVGEGKDRVKSLNFNFKKKQLIITTKQNLNFYVSPNLKIV